MTTGIKYISYPDHSGYGLAALAYVRALHNAGVPVWWAPLVVRDGRQTIWRPGDPVGELRLALGAEDDEALRDVPTLLRACGPRPYDTVVMHTVPEHWPDLVEAGKRHIGYTVWETDALPPHWPALLGVAEHIVVPCAMNRTLFADAGIARPVSAIPHIRRHAWNEASPGDIAGLRRQLGIPDDHFIFHTIGVWDARKAQGDLVEAFARAFSGHDRVTLVIKTSTAICGQSLEPRLAGGIRETVDTRLARVSRETGRPPPRVALIAADGIAGRVVDTLHALGDCFVSLTHGEGWGMGAFDAATLGKPVLITGYGGPAEFLGNEFLGNEFGGSALFETAYPGLIPYAMETVSGWAAYASFRPPQRWARADPDQAVRLMRRMVTHHGEFLDAAALAAERIANRYAEPVVARQWMALLDG